MKPGMEVGMAETLKIIVTKDMFAAFEGEVIHTVYSTVAMTYHMEWVSRKIILPFLESHEEGMGASVDVKHISPSLYGAELTLTATITELHANEVLTAIDVYNNFRLIGKGKVKQVILPKDTITKMFEAVST
ncbi:thioesterase [Sporosarcina sp. Marseille-Q4063]|uniref:thioesterase family protein n=1 Tax=Sporosarcina sp. Marseille-Q4063 TaxID=2810514 RepID=UPI001BAF0D82|nr:thioesterase [Sporosarcina sp. Marseille-Q4063]QUW22026.1 thioesterase [Sporosarcina sp. Marseille-Q4063]